MQKFILLFLAILVSMIVLVGMEKSRKPGISGGSSTVAPTPNSSPSSAISESTVPQPTGADIIVTFIQNINDQKIPEAIGLMDGNLITSDSDKQQYGVVFNSFSSISVKKIEMESFGKDLPAGGQETGGEGEERYKVVLFISLKPQGQKTLWDEGLNTRWITVKKQQGRFMIHDIATGP